MNALLDLRRPIYRALRTLLTAAATLLCMTGLALAQDQASNEQAASLISRRYPQYVRCTAFDLFETPGRAPQDLNCPATALFRDPREPRLPVRVCKAGTAEEEKACSGAFLAETDARLNAVYGEARKKLLRTSPQRERRLVAAQRQWLRFRATHCDEQGFSHGEVKSLARNSFLYRACLDLEAVRRTYYLETMVLGKEASSW